MHHRPLSEIAEEIRTDWNPVHPIAKPYVDAMATLQKIDDNYALDSAVDVLARFLGVCGTWKGGVARRVKTEIKGILAMQEGKLARQRAAA